MWPVLVLASAAVVSGTTARNFSDNDHLRLPQLFHLDNFERCLARPQGLYCTGTFRISADGPNPYYDFIKEYSSDEQHFDRTLIHRGYCLSANCPSPERNVSRRFELCAERRAVPGLRAALQTYSCQTPRELERGEMDTPQKLFLAVMLLILLFNIIGTAYDVMAGGEGKNKLLLAWSMRENWRRLVALPAADDAEHAALAPLDGVRSVLTTATCFIIFALKRAHAWAIMSLKQGTNICSRVLLLVLVMMTHATQILHKVYLYNPEFFEQVPRYGASMLMRNGASLVQVFFVLSSFLLARAAQRLPRTVTLRQLPACVLYRAARLAPLHLVCVGFAATWWSASGGGPQWRALAAEGAACRRKLWAHALFLHNFVEPDNHCLLPTWFLAVEMQLFVVTAGVTLWLRGREGEGGGGGGATRWLVALLTGAVALNAALAHYYGWSSLLYIMLPEKVRTTFAGEASFSRYYTAPWGSLPAALLGLLAARAHRHGRLEQRKWFRVSSRAALPLLVACLAGGRVPPRAAHAALERPAAAALAAAALLAFVAPLDSYFRRLAAWRGWAPAARASLAALLLHWLVNVRLAAARHTLSEVSVFTIGADLLSTIWWTLVAALPLTVLVETPTRRSATLSEHLLIYAAVLVHHHKLLPRYHLIDHTDWTKICVAMLRGSLRQCYHPATHITTQGSYPAVHCRIALPPPLTLPP
ncbi:unnamed protein product, partial [Brenthis ino]